MSDSPTIDPRRRLRELLAIPERDRTDEQWDEIIELEITMAPGNRVSDQSGDRPFKPQTEKRPLLPAGPGRRPEQKKPLARPPVQRTDPRPSVNRPEAPHEGAAEPRGPRRHARRPRRPPETPSEGGGSNG